MKRKEKEHLKQDPFVHFVETALALLKRAHRAILYGVGAVAVVALVVLAVVVWGNVSASKDNEVFAAARKIRSSAMSPEQKIEALKRLRPRRGTSAVVPLYIAGLYAEKGDPEQARAALREFRPSRIGWINDDKRLLEADLLAAAGKVPEAVALLDSLLADSDREVGGDRVLLAKARLLIRNERRREADSVLKKILAEYPESLGSMDARQLMASLEPSAT